MALAVIGLMGLLYRFRIRQLTTRANLQYAERLEERTRIARDLHDTMLQSLQSIPRPNAGGPQSPFPGVRIAHFKLSMTQSLWLPGRSRKAAMLSATYARRRRSPTISSKR